MLKKIYKNNDYVIINSMEEFQEKRKQYKKFVLSPQNTMNNFEQDIIVDNLSVVYSRRFLDIHLTSDCFNLLNTHLIYKVIKVQYIKVSKEKISKDLFIKSMRMCDYESKNLEEVLFVTENLYRDSVSEFTFREKKEREKFRDRLLHRISERNLRNSILFNNYDKQRLLKLKGNDFSKINSVKKIKFSIVCTMYNEEDNISQFCKMIEAIEYPSEYFEVILVNDGSTDGTGDIEQYTINSNINFKYLNINHSGVSIARNYGLRHVSNKYILFTDFDDVLSPNILEEGNVFFNSYPKINILGNPIYVLNDNKRSLHSLSRLKYNSRARYSIYNLVEMPSLYLSNVSGTFINKKVINNAQFTPNLNFFEDTSWINQIIEQNKIQLYGFANDSYYDYNVNKSSSLINNRYNDQFQIKLLLKEYIGVLSKSTYLSFRIACLKSINWFLSDALNNMEENISLDNLQLMRKMAGLISSKDFLHLKGDHVVSAIKLLTGVNNYVYQEYQIEKFNVQYYLYSELNKSIETDKAINPIHIFDVLVGYETKVYSPTETSSKKKINSILFMDKIFSAEDNAYYLYKYLKDKTTLNIYFALSSKSKDWKKLENEGFNLVSYASDEYKNLVSSVDCIMSSHVDKYIINYGDLRDNINDQTFVFLQHGVTNNDIKYWLFNKKIDYICTTFDFEEKLISQYFDSSQIITTGMPRIDYLNVSSRKYITYFTSWSKRLLELSDLEFINTNFFRRILNIHQAKSLQQICVEQGLTVEVKVHPNIEKKVSRCLRQYGLNVSVYEYNELISKSYIVLTDFSSVAFDALYTAEHVFFYNDNYHEYFCERKIIQAIDYDNFYIKRISNIEQINKFLIESSKEKNERMNCQNLCRQMGIK